VGEAEYGMGGAMENSNGLGGTKEEGDPQERKKPISTEKK